MGANILRWIGGLAAVSVALGYVALGATLVTWRALWDVARSTLLSGPTTDVGSTRSAA
jgi:hypothetical protein